MSILIQGMDMPNDCSECPCFQLEWFDDDIDGYCKALKTNVEYNHRRLFNCPAIEVPIPHGDLVDLSGMVHPNDSMRLMTIDEQLGRTCEEWNAEKKEYIIIEAEGSKI